MIQRARVIDWIKCWTGILETWVHVPASAWRLTGHTCGNDKPLDEYLTYLKSSNWDHPQIGNNSTRFNYHLFVKWSQLNYYAYKMQLQSVAQSSFLKHHISVTYSFYCCVWRVLLNSSITPSINRFNSNISSAMNWQSWCLNSSSTKVIYNLYLSVCPQV